MDEPTTEAATALARPPPFTGLSTSPSHAAAAMPARHSRCSSHGTRATAALGSRLASDRHFPSRPWPAHDSVEASSREALCWGLLTAHPPGRDSRLHLPTSAVHRAGCHTHPRLHQLPPGSTIWSWFAATWAAVTGEGPPPLSADLLLADDQRTWQPASQLGPLWHRMRLVTICQLWAAYQRARHQQDTAETAGVVAARILSSCRKAILGDWRLATVNVRTASGVLSDWLRGRDPKLTREEFAARWCHRNVLCTVGEEPDAQLLIPWSAQHPVPLPA